MLESGTLTRSASTWVAAQAAAIEALLRLCTATTLCDAHLLGAPTMSVLCVLLAQALLIATLL
jgi:hypothetical protein